LIVEAMLTLGYTIALWSMLRALIQKSFIRATGRMMAVSMHLRHCSKV